MTLTQILARQREALTRLVTERSAVAAQLIAYRDHLPESGDVPTELAENISAAIAQRASLDTQIDTARADMEGTEREIEREASIAALQRELVPTGAGRGLPAYDQVARVGQEKRTYSPDNAREGISFLRDVVAGTFGSDLSALQRLQRHSQEEHVERGDLLQRDVGTSAFGGLTVPQYLLDLVAPKVAAGRPFADNCQPRPLPATGMTVEISRITTGTSAAAQATQNTDVSETDIDDTQLTVNVRTVAGQQDVARQVIDRSAGAEDIIVADLAKRYHTALNSDILNADGTLGTHLGLRSTVGINTVTYTDSSGTPAEAWGTLWDLQAQCETDTFMPLTHYVMHPRRWAWFCAAIGTNTTMVQSSGVPVQLLGAEQSKQYGAGVRGILAGLPVIADGSIPTTISSTQDVILGVNFDELYLWEQPNSPLMIRAEQPGAGSLSVKLVVYGYSAFTAGRYPESHGTISGTGLGTPTYGIAAS